MTVFNTTNPAIKTRKRLIAAAAAVAILGGTAGVAAAADGNPVETPTATIDSDAGEREEGTDVDGAGHAVSEGTDVDADND